MAKVARKNYEINMKLKVSKETLLTYSFKPMGALRCLYVAIVLPSLTRGLWLLKSVCPPLLTLTPPLCRVLSSHLILVRSRPVGLLIETPDLGCLEGSHTSIY